MDSVGNVFRLSILGYLNGWTGDGTIAGVIGVFGVPGENANGKRVVEFCFENTEVRLSTKEWQGVKTEWRLRT